MAQNLNCKCNNLPIRTTNGIEKVVSGIVAKLKTCITISSNYCVLGLAEIREEIRENEPYTLPQYYISNREWYNLEPTTDVEMFSFFYSDSPKTSFSEDFSIYEQDLNLIFWVNTEQLFDTTNYISTDELITTVLNALSNSRFDAIVSINSIVDGFDATWNDFDIVNDKTMKFNFKNYITFKVNLTLNVKEQYCKC